ncbi:MAG TPA: hypothetical protein VE912_03425, partial [Bacteroidales bacterium]|nr:hypothetical protein [Bacteroidales bacterium]
MIKQNEKEPQRRKGAEGESNKNQLDNPADFQSRYHFHHTSDIIRAAQNGQLPDKIMITVHPQRWTNSP